MNCRANQIYLKRNTVLAVLTSLIIQTITFGVWSSDPEIEAVQLSYKPAQDWIHISQCYLLVAYGEDYDSLCGNEDYEDRVLADTITWFGDGLWFATGCGNGWDTQHWVENSEVYAEIDDDPTEPDGSNTDDDSKDTPIATFNAWEAKATLSVEGESQVITESGYGTGVDGVLALIEGDLNGSASASWPNDPGPNSFISQIDITWKMEHIPDDASVYTATGVFQATADMDGTLSCEADDDDFDPLGGGDLSVGVDVGGDIVGVGIEYTPDWLDECEAMSGIAFGFDSDVVDSCGGTEEYAIAVSSGDVSNEDSVEFEHYPGVGWASGSLSGDGTTKEAQIKVKGWLEARGYVQQNAPYMYVKSSASIECTESWYSIGIAGVDVTASSLHYTGQWIDLYPDD